MTDLDELKEEKESTLSLSSQIKHEDAFKKLCRLVHVSDDQATIDVIIYAILFAFYEKDLVRFYIESCCGEKFDNGCGQYVFALATVLKTVRASLEITVLRAYQTDIKQNHISIKSPPKKWGSVGFIPHVFLGIKIKGNKYIIDPKYFSVVVDMHTATEDKKRLHSKIPAQYHAPFDKEVMQLPHQDNPRKSLIFFNYLSLDNNSHNFDVFPLFAKDKNGKKAVYKVFQAITLKQ